MDDRQYGARPDWNRDGWNQDGRRSGDWNKDGRRPDEWSQDGRRPDEWNQDGRRRDDWNRGGRIDEDWNQNVRRPDDWEPEPGHQAAAPVDDEMAMVEHIRATMGIQDTAIIQESIRMVRQLAPEDMASLAQLGQVRATKIFIV